MNRSVKPIIVYAPSVRSYGGATLLQSLADIADPNMRFILNDHIQLPRLPENYERTGGGWKDQLRLERKLQHELNDDSVLLCMTNKPPFLKLPGFVVTGLLSVFAIEIPARVPVTVSRRLKSTIQIYLNIFLKRNTDVFLARSQSMVNVCKKKTNTRTVYFPFTTSTSPLTRSLAPPRAVKGSCVFFYPSDAAPHKNLKRVFEAWEILVQRGVQAKLVTTISEDTASSLDVNFSRDLISAVGFLDEQALKDQYDSADALLFPSLLESFPLPIIEARAHGLPIVASEREFIREQVDPEETFDPHCALSIASAVERMMGIYSAVENRPSIEELPEYLRSLRDDC